MVIIDGRILIPSRSSGSGDGYGSGDSDGSGSGSGYGSGYGYGDSDGYGDGYGYGSGYGSGYGRSVPEVGPKASDPDLVMAILIAQHKQTKQTER